MDRMERPFNEAGLVRNSAPGSRERPELWEILNKGKAKPLELPLLVGGRKGWTDRFVGIPCPHDRSRLLAGTCEAAEKEMAVEEERTLRFTAGNFYISDKPMGAIVERRPFGGPRHSGTNGKAGYRGNLMRRLSPRIVKENIVPARERKSPFLD